MKTNVAATLALVAAACATAAAQDPSTYTRYSGDTCADPPNSIFTSALTASCATKDCEAVNGAGYESITCPGTFAPPSFETSWGVYGTATVYSDSACETPVVYAGIKDGACYYVGDIETQLGTLPVAAESSCASGSPSGKVCIGSPECGDTCLTLDNTDCTEIPGAGFYVKIGCANSNDGVATAPLTIAAALVSVLAAAVTFL